MVCAIMALLTELRSFHHEQPVMVAAVRIMAIKAILFHWGMLPHERTSFFRMTLVAEFVDRISLDHRSAEFAMGIMAIGA